MTKSENVMIRISAEQKARLFELAANRGISASSFVRELIETAADDAATEENDE